MTGTDEGADITDERCWQALVHLYQGIGFVLDGEGRYVDVISPGNTDPLLFDDPGELLGRRIHDVVPADRADRFLAAVRHALATDSVQTITYRLDVQAGTRWFEASVAPLPVEDDDSAHALWMARDVTRYKRRERDLRANERRFEAIFDDPHALIGILNPDGSVRRINRTAMRFVDADAADLEGEPFWEAPWWTHSESLQEDLRGWIDRAAAGNYVEYEATHYTATGERMLVDGLFRPVTDDEGEVVSIIVSGRDVTERERQKQRLQVLHRILRHNLRNGLNTIQGYAERIAEAPDDERRREMATTITGRAKDLTELAEKLHYFRRIYERRPQESVTVDDLFARVVDEIDRKYPDCGVAVTTPDVAVAVPQSTELAVYEAVENAIEHHDRPSPTIELACETAVDEEPLQVTLLIADDGPGIPADERDPIVSGEETTLDHASSIGLWLIKWATDNLGGELAIADNEPRGTVVSLTLPCSLES